MGSSNHTIEVNAPLRVVYNQWTQFEEFPRFMEGIEEVRQEGDKRLLWKARIAGKVKEWEAEITDQVPDQKIAWQSIDGSPNAGTITFNALDSDTTEVNAEIEYESEGLLEKTGDLLGIPSGRIEGDLRRFRDYIEERGRETGGWRGQISEENTLEMGVLPTSGSQLEAPVANLHTSKDETFSRTASRNQGEISSESTIEVPLSEETDQLNVPVTATKSAGGFRESNEAETYRQAVRVPEQAGEHEADMGARVSDKEETEKIEPKDIAVNDLERETANVDTATGLRSTLFEPDKEEIARRAYDIYLARGQAAGQEMDDWIEAKRQLLEESHSKI